MNTNYDRLRYHLELQKPLGVRPPKAKKDGPQRWRTWAITLIADTIKWHRKTLGLDMEFEDVPTAAEVISLHRKERRRYMSGDTAISVDVPEQCRSTECTIVPE